MRRGGQGDRVVTGGVGGKGEVDGGFGSSGGGWFWWEKGRRGGFGCCVDRGLTKWMGWL